MLFLIVGAALLMGLFYVISIYNYFQITKTRVSASIQEIGNQLKRQASLIPNLLEATKGYLSHEKDIFADLTQARQAILSAGDNDASIGQAAEVMDKLLPRFMAIAESNPEIKADGVVSKLMNEVRDTADKLMYARRTLIDLSQDYNAKLLTFPSNVIASQFGFKAIEGLKTPETGTHVEVSAEEMKDVEVKL